jgi:type II secretory pathway component PulF
VINLLGVFALSIPSLFVLGAIATVLVILTGAGGYLINFIILIGFVLLGSAARRMQIERKCRLLNYLKLATAKNLPLPEFLDTLRNGEGYGVGTRAGLIADDLRLGFGLGEAMINHVPEVPLHQSAVIWRGEQAGRLSESVARVADNASSLSRDTPSARNDIALQYALVVFIALLGLTSLVGMFVLPHYVEIFEDFQADYPAITKYTWDWVAVFSPVLLVVSIIALLGIIGWTTHGLFHTSELFFGPLRRVMEPLWWRVPVLSSAYRNRALADACFMIEQAMRSGRPLPEAIESARHPLQSSVIDKRLDRFAQHLRQGQSLTDAAKAAKLPPLVVGMLGTASAASQPADVFDFLCRYYTERVSPLEAMLKAAMLPLATLLAATCVAWFVFSIFYPLVVLIEASIDWTGLS